MKAGKKKLTRAKKKIGIPIKFIGVGEKVSDLMLFNADDYVEALFPGN